MSKRERPTIRERMTTEGLTAEAALHEARQEHDELQALLAAERQGAIGREQALEEARGLADRLLMLLDDLETRHEWSCTSVWITKAQALMEEALSIMPQREEEGAPLPPACCRTGCRRPAEEQFGDGCYCAEHWREAIHEGIP